VRRKGSVLANLLARPQRFRFDAAVRVLMRLGRTSDPGRAMQFRSELGGAFAATEINAVETAAGTKPRLTTAMIGLVGAGGVLPRLYESLAGDSRRRGSGALHAFLDVLAQRMIAHFARAGIKYRLHRSAELAAPRPDPIGTSLLALTGYATPGLVERLATGSDPLLHFAGIFAMRPRSADRLAGLLSDWLGRPVTVEQFAGQWMSLPLDQQTSLPRLSGEGTWNQLGVDAAIGDRCWDIQGRIVLHIGPLDRADFEALLPEQPAHQRLVSLVHAYLGLEVGFAINPILMAAAQTPLVLRTDRTPRLGWTTWLADRESKDGTEAVFEAA
jgi:type VI secretion system protein ImpH